MSGADFIDSNVIVYLFDATDARRRGIAEEIVFAAPNVLTPLWHSLVIENSFDRR